MKKIWYQIIKFYIGTSLSFFFKKVVVYGKENIPSNGAVLFVSNHKNALIDPLLIATTSPRDIHFLTRASAFKIKLVHWFLSTLNMIPIYRIRDGKETIAKNEFIFNQCFDILNKHKVLLIFPEGTHEIKRMVKPLKKGFARITFGTLEKHPNLQLHILPIGLNYTNATLFGESVSIYYGKPILANSFFNKDELNTSMESLKTEVFKHLIELTSHIENDNYNKIISQLGNIDYLNPKEVNKVLEHLPNYTPNSTSKKEPSLFWKILKIIVSINSFIPLLIYKAFVPKIKETEFISTTKFGIGVTAFPIFYLLQSLVINYFFGYYFSLIYLFISVLLVLLLAKSKG